MIFYFSNDSEVAGSLSDIYPVGVFVQIHELDDLGKKLRLIVMAHRRISITKSFTPDELKEEEVKDNIKIKSSMYWMKFFMWH